MKLAQPEKVGRAVNSEHCNGCKVSALGKWEL